MPRPLGRSDSPLLAPSRGLRPGGGLPQEPCRNGSRGSAAGFPGQHGDPPSALSPAPSPALPPAPFLAPPPAPFLAPPPAPFEFPPASSARSMAQPVRPASILPPSGSRTRGARPRTIP